MTQVETNVIQAMANAGNVDKTLQNHVLKLVIAHDKAVANYKNATKACRKLEAQLEDMKTDMVKDGRALASIDLRKKVDKTEEKW